MPTFERCPKTVNDMAMKLMNEFESHRPLLNCEPKIDFVFAYPEYDEKTGAPVEDALKKNGVKALGICRKLSLKDRAMGRGDAEIALDGDWWARANEPEQRALLDHELHHLMPKVDKRGLVTDDLGRPVFKLRPHDHDVGWFSIIAQRHGRHSIECQQAKRMVDEAGQFYWPELAGLHPTMITLKAGNQEVTMTDKELHDLPSKIRKMGQKEQSRGTA